MPSRTSGCSPNASPTENERNERVKTMSEHTQRPQGMHTNEELYRRQVEMLRLFLRNHAITQAQFDKSCHDLTVKMGFAEPDETTQDE